MNAQTQELTGAALDWAAAKCEGIDLFETEGWIYMDGTRAVFRPSTDWRQGGPIIERERIKVAPNLGGTWLGQIRHETTHPLVDKPVLAGWTNKHGPTPLIAAMRCYVASKMGDEIEVPDELL